MVNSSYKQKGNTSKNAQEDDQNSTEFLEDLPSVYTEDSRDMLKHYMLPSEYHLIDSSLVGHDPGVATSPRTNCQSHEIGKQQQNSRVGEMEYSDNSFFVPEFLRFSTW